MNKSTLPFLGIGLVIALGILSTGVFILPETRSAIVVRVGEPTAQYQDAGLHLKMPLVTSVEYIDKRNRELDQPEIEIIASNQERLIVDAFARYRVIDPLLFYQSVRTEEQGEVRLRSITEDAVRAVLGEVSVDDVVSTQRAALMRRIQSLLSARTRAFGVEIIDVKIRRADLPPQNSAAVFQRMITERQQLAQQIRAEGNEAAQQIRAQSEREATEIRSAAEEESQKIRGAADAERNAVFAAAYNKDQEFFAFYRSLLAYEQALQSGETTILLSPDSEFFRYFNDLNGGRR